MKRKKCSSFAKRTILVPSPQSLAGGRLFFWASLLHVFAILCPKKDMSGYIKRWILFASGYKIVQTGKLI